MKSAIKKKKVTKPVRKIKKLTKIEQEFENLLKLKRSYKNAVEKFSARRTTDIESYVASIKFTVLGDKTCTRISMRELMLMEDIFANAAGYNNTANNVVVKRFATSIEVSRYIPSAQGSQWVYYATAQVDEYGGYMDAAEIICDLINGGSIYKVHPVHMLEKHPETLVFNFENFIRDQKKFIEDYFNYDDTAKRLNGYLMRLFGGLSVLAIYEDFNYLMKSYDDLNQVKYIFMHPILPKIGYSITVECEDGVQALADRSVNDYRIGPEIMGRLIFRQLNLDECMQARADMPLRAIKPMNQDAP